MSKWIAVEGESIPSYMRNAGAIRKWNRADCMISVWEYQAGKPYSDSKRRFSCGQSSTVKTFTEAQERATKIHNTMVQKAQALLSKFNTI